MTLLLIVVGTLVAGMGSVWLAALLAYALLSRFTQHLLSLAAGALLATAFTRLLPEAFELSQEAGVSAHALFFALLVGLVFFFLLDKAELWHHGHEHGHDHGAHAHDAHDGHHHHHGHNHHSGGWAVLLGDSVHAFGGSISAEHGVGQLKRDQLPRYKTELELKLMKRIKDALDPKGLMNPGKVLQA